MSSRVAGYAGAGSRNYGPVDAKKKPGLFSLSSRLKLHCCGPAGTWSRCHRFICLIPRFPSFHSSFIARNEYIHEAPLKINGLMNPPHRVRAYTRRRCITYEIIIACKRYQIVRRIRVWWTRGRAFFAPSTHFQRKDESATTQVYNKKKRKKNHRGMGKARCCCGGHGRAERKIDSSSLRASLRCALGLLFLLFFSKLTISGKAWRCLLQIEDVSG